MKISYEMIEKCNCEQEQILHLFIVEDKYDSDTTYGNERTQRGVNWFVPLS